MKFMWFADDLMVVEAVSCEPVSTQNSLLTGKIQGKFAKRGVYRQVFHKIPQLKQWFN